MTKEEHIPVEEWARRSREHRNVISPYTIGFRSRRTKGKSHPIHDFLFRYYTYSSTKLEKWHPGFGYTLECTSDSEVSEFLDNPLYERTKTGVSLKYDAIRPRELKQLFWIKKLSEAIAEREPRYGCLGLHEWAMVYRAPDTRHDYPLRLSHNEISLFLENTTVCCSHFDAFRFFTKPAAPLNVLQPTADDRLKFEQGGCLHANMDLYKWSFKLSPLIPSELLRECFLLAIDAREIDMRASPYDFEPLGFYPIKIETLEGQEEYKKLQRAITSRSAQLRLTLLKEIERILLLVRSEHLTSAYSAEASL